MLSIIRYLPLLLILCTPALADTFRLSSPGLNGMNGTPGYSPGGSGFNGTNGFAGARGGDGQRGQDGRDATSPTHGGNAGHILFHIERDPADATKLIYTGNVDGKNIGGILDSAKVTSIILNAAGGHGGDGAAGGRGQDGGTGGNGGEADQLHFSSGDGGRGGDGGNAGAFTNGAAGGNGGQILLHLKKGQEDLSKLVHPAVNGGSGGAAPFTFSQAGRGGQGGQGGNNCYFHPTEGYKCVVRGLNGSNGLDGRGSFGTPQAGAAGSPGVFQIEVAE